VSASLHFVKLGGSLITDKQRPLTPRPAIIQRLAHEIAAARAAHPDRPLLLSHGSGSYGHVVGRRYRTRAGVGPTVAADPAGWRGFCETGYIAAQLNRLVMAALLQAGLPAISLAPSALVRCRGGAIIAIESGPILAALDRGLIPLVFGDVAFDETQGATIVSTEEVLAALVPILHPDRLTLAGMVDGVFDADPARQPDARPLPRLSAAQIDDLAAAFGGSHGIDVTGGMAAKLRTMAALLSGRPDLRIYLLSGEIPGQLQRHLINPDLPLGTLLAAQA
jgi:isopentenyl phosphate kinase